MSHGTNPGYHAGQNLAVCDVCAEVHLSSEMRRRWDNLLVCHKDYEQRHPQDYVRGVRDDMRAPLPNPEPPDTFLNAAVSRESL